MITDEEKKIIAECACKFNVSAVILFGSAADLDEGAADIDLAVIGLKENMFFKFLGELMRKLAKPVDLIDLSQKNSFSSSIQKRGIKIYG